MFCRNCAYELSPKAIACPQCGIPPLKGNEYCNNCGSSTHPEAIICVKCGIGLKKSLFPNNSSVMNEAIKQPVFWASIVLIIAFFLPWLDLLIITISGWQMKDLARFAKLSDEAFEINSLVYLIYLLPILGALIISSFFTENEFIQHRLKTFKILVGLYPFLFLMMLLGNSGFKIIDYLAYGFIITLIAGAYIFYNGVKAQKSAIEPKKKDPRVPEIVIEKNIIPHPTKGDSQTLLEKDSYIYTTDDSYNAEYDKLFNSNKKTTRVKFILIIIGLVVITGIILFFTSPNNETENSKTSSETITALAPQPLSTVNKSTEDETQPTNQYNNIADANLTYQPYLIIVQRAYFYASPDFSARLNSFVVSGQTIKACCLTNSFYYAVFLNSQGQQTEGYINQGDLEPSESTSQQQESFTGFFQGVRIFCDDDDYWKYEVEIEKNKIILKLYPGDKNENFVDKSRASEIIQGSIKNDQIITKDSPDYLTNRFKLVNNILYEVNNEGGLNEYKICEMR